MKLKVNGRDIEFDGKTVLDLVDHYRLDRGRVVVERNGKIVHRQDIERTLLEEGDSLELVRFVGGG
ncbi:MAG TPA: sulfur carrier protein ThiS [Spirochaetota bacterium]|nr:sulfur carrier protein ThiS [Spirochaetota bacterium]HPI89009.1 sulfur carrier protein ThiS [Spirochaetota bacterium]HPR49283.1 sulfur carrier protein ThiS [Spirochaetota bacterium]